eukprot:m.50221 g.50221  ORF g.50221 m.50221 type:complete len:228 (-) comp18008_c0_seq1:47-730(-)
MHVNTGIAGLHTIFSALTDNGYGDVAIGIVAQTTEPSLSYMAAHDSTLWERWYGQRANGTKQSGTWNHIMFSPGAFFYQNLAGIVPLTPDTHAFTALEVKPLISCSIAGLEASVFTIHGHVNFTWALASSSVCQSSQPQQPRANQDILSTQLIVPTMVRTTQFVLSLTPFHTSPQTLVVTESDKPVWMNGQFHHAPGIVNGTFQDNVLTLQLLGGATYNFAVATASE